ncbi:hypothetical protein CAPTEDRAFT_187805, partial [Capitella teleta]
MLAIAQRVGFDLHIKLNAAKSQLLLFNPGQHREVFPVYFSGTFVSQSTEAVHLGHLISFDSKLPPICSAEDLTRRTNILASRFGHCGLEVKYRLFKAHCMSAYGFTGGQSIPFMSACSTSENAIVQRCFKEIILGSRSADDSKDIKHEVDNFIRKFQFVINE